MRFQAVATTALIACSGHATAQPMPRLDITAAESVELLDSMAPTNAALVYYQLLLNENKPLYEAYVHFNEDEGDDETFGSTRAEAEQALIDGQGVLDSFAAASRIPRCDFGIQYQNGWAAVLPHLGKLRSVARALHADAIRHLEAGDADKATDRLESIYRMSGQVLEDRLLISSLVGIAIANLAHKTTSEMIESGALTEGGRDLLIEAIEGFGDDDPFLIRDCIKMEGAISVGWVARSFPEGQAGTRLAQWQIIDAENRALIRRLDAMNGNELRAEAERMLDYYRAVLQAWDEDDAAVTIDALGTVVNVGGYGELAKGFAAAFGKVLENDLRARADLHQTLDLLRAYRPEQGGSEATEREAPGR